MNKKFIIILATCLTSVFVLGNGLRTYAKDQVNCPSGAICVTLNSVNINDTSYYEKSMEKLEQYAELDNVDKETACEKMTGMSPVLIGGFDVVSTDRGGSGANEGQKKAMLWNTWILQQVIKCSSEKATSKGEQAYIRLPAGTFYFVSGHLYMAEGSAKTERHAIKLHNNVTIIGAGSEQNQKSTTSKLYSEKKEFKTISGEDIPGGIDMFFFNNYSAYNFDTSKQIYLKNIHFQGFIIDSSETSGVKYNTSGKGFMINLFENGTWDNVTVKNTDGTGFGVDCPIGRSGIYNSRAYNNGKGVTKLSSGGGSGFGIGTGYSDDENFEIANSTANKNGLYGFFYEHQGRFEPQGYEATNGKFIIKDSKSINNTWNYGGLRSNDVYLENVQSEIGDKTIRNVHFSDESREIQFVKYGVKLEKSAFNDASNSSEDSFYYDALLWAESRGIAGDMIESRGEKNNARNDNYAAQYNFNINEIVTRADAITSIWRMMGMPGNTISAKNGNLEIQDGKAGRILDIQTCFDDVPSYKAYAEAVAWAYREGITLGTKSCTAGKNDGKFDPDAKITRAQFITMLYRLNGEPTIETYVEDFGDVTDKTAYYYDAVQWALQNKLTNGTGDNHFSPNSNITRKVMVTFLYRYWLKFSKDGCGANCNNILDELLDYDHNKNKNLTMTSFGNERFLK